MREYYINYGHWQGWHKLYDGEEDFKKHLPNTEFKVWGLRDDIYSKDWVMAWDGFIVQCLKRGNIIKQPNGNYIIPFRFPMVTVAAYYTEKKTTYYAFHAMFTPPHKNSVSGSLKDKKTDQMKRLFGFMLSQGASLFTSYAHIFKQSENQNKLTNKYHDRIKINQLLADPIVRSEFMNGSTPFLQGLENKIPDSKIIEELERAISQAAPGSTAHINAIKLVMAIKGLDGNVGGMLPAEKKRSALPPAEDTPYKEIENTLPPELEDD